MMPVNRPNAGQLKHRPIAPIMMEIVSTNIIASRPPEQQSNSMPTAHVNIFVQEWWQYSYMLGLSSAQIELAAN